MRALKASINALSAGVPGLEKFDVVQVCPLVEQASSELRAIIDPYGFRLATLCHETVEDLDFQS